MADEQRRRHYKAPRVYRVQFFIKRKFFIMSLSLCSKPFTSLYLCFENNIQSSGCLRPIENINNIREGIRTILRFGKKRRNWMVPNKVNNFFYKIPDFRLWLTWLPRRHQSSQLLLGYLSWSWICSPRVRFLFSPGKTARCPF